MAVTMDSRRRSELVGVQGYSRKAPRPVTIIKRALLSAVLFLVGFYAAMLAFGILYLLLNSARNLHVVVPVRPSALIIELLALAAMSDYFWRRHPGSRRIWLPTLIGLVGFLVYAAVPLLR
jgi:hypothetical protein